MTKLTMPRIILSSILIFLFLTSCERFQWATIINDSNKNLTIRIKYNSDQRIEIVKLEPSEQYEFRGGNIRQKPTFGEIEEIEILKNDTLLLKTKSMFLDELFSTDEDKGIYELRIE